MTRWGKLITQLTGFAVEEDPEEKPEVRRFSGDGLPPEPHSPSYEATTTPHWLTTLTPEALVEIRDRDRPYCQTCSEADRSNAADDGIHLSLAACEQLRGSPCVSPKEHHSYVAGGLPPSWDSDARDRALLLRALDEAIGAAEDC